MDTVLRVARHPLDERREKILKDIFGEVQILTDDVQFKGNPVRAVRETVEEIEIDGDRVVAIEVIAPLEALGDLVEHFRAKGIKLIRAKFEIDLSTGRNKVIGKDDGGRDILALEDYVELDAIEIRTKSLPLLVKEVIQ